MMQSNTELFLDKYRQLEAVIRANFRLNDDDKSHPVGFLMRQREWKSIRMELDMCREVRNLLSHNYKMGCSSVLTGKMIAND